MNKFLKTGIFIGAGALLGYLYYYFWGCTDGCPLKSNWLTMTGYGALVGLVIGMPVKKKRKSPDKINDDKINKESREN